MKSLFELNSNSNLELDLCRSVSTMLGLTCWTDSSDTIDVGLAGLEIGLNDYRGGRTPVGEGDRDDVYFCRESGSRVRINNLANSSSSYLNPNRKRGAPYSWRACIFSYRQICPTARISSGVFRTTLEPLTEIPVQRMMLVKLRR